jgi:hypothetical protein
MGATAEPDLGVKVWVALEVENTGNQHQRRNAIVARAVEAMFRVALGESDDLGQAS